MIATLLKRDETIAQKEINLQILEEKQELLRKQLINAKAQLDLLKHIMIGHLESNGNQICF